MSNENEPTTSARIGALAQELMEQVERDTDRDRFMSAEDAKVYGLIDNVVSLQAELATR